MHALFVCILTEHPARPGMFGPRVMIELRAEIPPNVYVSIRANEARPVAIGLAQLTTQQAALFDAMPGVWVFDARDWRTKRVSEIPAGVRTRLNSLLTDRGISAGITMQDTVAQAIGKIVTAIGEDPQALLARYRSQTGTEL